MIVWIDAQLSPLLAPWLTETFSIDAFALRDIGLRDAEDKEIFEAARVIKAVVLTKDQDFVDMIARLGSPPQIIWLTCGNTSNKKLREILIAALPEVLKLFGEGESLVEISDNL